MVVYMPGSRSGYYEQVGKIRRMDEQRIRASTIDGRDSSAVGDICMCDLV